MVPNDTRRNPETATPTSNQPLQQLPQAQPPLFVGLPGAFAAPLPAALPYGVPFGAYAPGYPALAPLPFPGALANLPPPPLAAPHLPAAIQDHGREIVATFEVPGIAAEDLQVVVASTSITVQGQRPAVNGRTYQGTFALPNEILPSQASARLEHGLLVVTLPRRAPTEEPRRVEVEP